MGVLLDSWPPKPFLEEVKNLIDSWLTGQFRVVGPLEKLRPHLLGKKKPIWGFSSRIRLMVLRTMCSISQCPAAETQRGGRIGAAGSLTPKLTGKREDPGR